MPTPKQMEKLATFPDRPFEPPLLDPPPTPRPADEMPHEYWDEVLRDPSIRSGVPIQNRRLSEIPRHVLRVWCRRCDRTVEIQATDAIRLHGNNAIWKDVAKKLLDSSCQQRTDAVRKTAAGLLTRTDKDAAWLRSIIRRRYQAAYDRP